MSRYFSRRQPSANDREMVNWQGFPLVPDINVSDHKASNTGLFDKDGNIIMRGPNPMGFVWK